MTALNPVMTIVKQIAEPLKHHFGINHRDAVDRVVKLMASVGIPEPQERLKQYPHQLSGGLRQRVAIAMALACKPKLLIADEPVTALDVTVQAGILNLLEKLRQESNTAIILVTHDLGMAIERCQNIGVMYAGKLVEKAPARKLYDDFRMPYTKALFDSLPRLENPVHTVLKTIDGQPPHLFNQFKGCRFAPRCPYKMQRCLDQEPKLSSVDVDHASACWYPLGTGKR